MNERYSKLIDEILASRKYRGLGIPRETVSNLFVQESELHKNEKELLKAVKEKMHHLVAPYLGDPDYAQAASELKGACTEGSEAIKSFCESLLRAHTSTRERLPSLTEFYQSIFAVTSKPAVILDLACGLHPFGLPWMDLPAGARYHAYDIHQPRVYLINHFLKCLHFAELAEVRDILVEPPEVAADLAFFLKEAHRLDARRAGANRDLWQALNCRWLVVSLPAQSMSGKHDLRARHQRLVDRILKGSQWLVETLELGDELVYCINKT